MFDFEQLKQKYQPVIDTIQKDGGQLENLNRDGDQLYLKATVSSEEAKNHVWDAIKAVDPSYRDLKHDIQVGAQARQQAAKKSNQTYTVQAGDDLSKISNQFYGDPNKYKKIVDANKLDDPDKIKAGQQLIIPAA